MKTWFAVGFLVCAAVPAAAQQTDAITPEFASIDARSIVSAELDLDPVYEKIGPAKGGEDGNLKLIRTHKVCRLTPAQIGVAIAILKRSRFLTERRDGIGSDFSVEFKKEDGARLVVVLGHPEQRYGGDTVSFFDDRLVAIKDADRQALRAMATDAGCKP